MLLLALLVAAAILRLFVPPRPPKTTAAKNACINNLLQLQGAKEQWSIENKLPALTEPDAQALGAYIKGGMPSCPNGGRYVLHRLGFTPQCSILKHNIPQTCRGNVRMLSNALRLWSREKNENAPGPFAIPQFVGFGKPLLHLPVCELGGKYLVDTNAMAFECSLGVHE